MGLLGEMQPLFSSSAKEEVHILKHPRYSVNARVTTLSALVRAVRLYFGIRPDKFRPEA